MYGLLEVLTRIRISVCTIKLGARNYISLKLKLPGESQTQSGGFEKPFPLLEPMTDTYSKINIEARLILVCNEAIKLNCCVGNQIFCKSFSRLLKTI